MTGEPGAGVSRRDSLTQPPSRLSQAAQYLCFICIKKQKEKSSNKQTLNIEIENVPFNV